MVISRIAKVVCLGSAVAFFTGCSSDRPETGYQDFNKVQVQFFAPTGASVTMGDQICGAIIPNRTHEISAYDKDSSRLERCPEETATFNLAPGRYEFKYAGLKPEDWNGVNIYGDVQIYCVSDLVLPGSNDMIRRTFIPVALPAPTTTLSTRDSIFPYQSPAGLRITYADLGRLEAGDMVTKVVFIADLKKIKCVYDKLEVEYVCLAGKHEQLRRLFSESKLNWLEDPCCDAFIEYQCKLKKVEQQIDENRAKAARYKALLDANNVLIRRDMMVLATDEVLPPHEDPVVSASELGQVVLVMHVGGRHLQWGCETYEVVDSAQTTECVTTTTEEAPVVK
jgi:hypothetical protein